MFFLQSKLDEEREIYDQERDSTDEKFRALELKIKGNKQILFFSSDLKFKNLINNAYRI